MTNILKVLVGSRAHELHTEESDYDYRGVFIAPTTEILKLGGTTKHTSWKVYCSGGDKKENNLYKVNDFLLEIRREYWDAN